LGLLDLDHAAKIFQFQRTTEVIQIVHMKRAYSAVNST